MQISLDFDFDDRQLQAIARSLEKEGRPSGEDVRTFIRNAVALSMDEAIIELDNSMPVGRRE